MSSSTSSSDNFLSGALRIIITVVAFAVVTGVIAVANGAFGGPPIFQATAGYLGFEIPGVIRGPGRGLLVLTLIIGLTYAFEFRGIQMSAPFWVGIFMAGLVVSKFLLPDFVTGAFAFLNLGQLFLGLKLSEINVARTVVLGISFVFIYYIALIRTKGAFGIYSGFPSGASDVDSVFSTTIQAIEGLMRDYRDVLVGIAGLFGVIGLFSAAGVGQSFTELLKQAGFLAEPGWGGYIISLSFWWINSFTSWLPFALSPEELGGLFFIIFAMAAIVYYTD